MNKILKKISLTFFEINYNLKSIVLFSSFALYVISTFYACFVFVQFSVLEILYVSASFFFILVALCLVFFVDIFKGKLQLNKFNIFFVLIISGYLLIILNSIDSYWYQYFRTFPLLEAENGLGWHQDSAMHVSIIHSYNLFGFPSVGQHGTPLLFYHTLSHLIDAIVLFITGLDAWDTYGLFFYFKRVLLVITILIFIASVSAKLKFFIFLLSVIIILPSIIGTWHSVGSHGLWFSSLLLIASAPFFFNIIFKINNKLSDFIILLFMIIFISLAKISHGAILLILICLIIFFNNKKNPHYYIFFFCAGFFLVTFAYLSNKSIFSSFKFDFLNILYFPIYSFKNGTFYFREIFLQILLIGIVAFFYNSKPVVNLFISAIISILFLSLLSIQPFLSKQDIWYFAYALQIILFITIYQLAIKTSELQRRFIFLEKIYYINNLNHIFIIIIMFLGLNNTDPALKFTKKTLWHFNSQLFEPINELDPKLKVSAKKLFANRNFINFEKYPRPLKSFKAKLNEFMILHNLQAKSSLLFISKNIFENEIAKNFSGISWTRGQLIYAVVGIPLYKGLENLDHKQYGLDVYTPDALMQYRDDFRVVDACRFNKDIIIVEDFVRGKFSLIKCKK